MHHSDFVLTLLRCPETGESLQLLTAEQSSAIKVKLDSLCVRQNIGIKPGQVSQVVMNQSKTLAYPVIEGIFGLLPALAWSVSEQSLPSSISGEKRVLLEFYNDFGWKPDDDQDYYKDAVAFEDLRQITHSYRKRCHRRVNNELPSEGQVILDCASGPVQIPEYRSFSENFAWRLCVDLSITALMEARKRLGDHGIYVLGDITKLPIADNAMDACISLHTIYHVPQKEQKIAVAELVRVSKVSAPVVIVYSWGADAPVYKWTMKLKSWLAGNVKAAASKPIPELYFHAHTYPWYKKEIEPNYNVKLKVWRSVEKEGLSLVQTSFGETMLLLLYFIEQMMPKTFGKLGVCPMFIIKKKK